MKLTWEQLRLELEYPFTISRSTRDSQTVVWVRIHAEGLEGWGEADPSAYYNESADTVSQALSAYREVIEDSEEPLAPESIERIERALGKRLPGNGSARAAISAALHDLQGKLLDRPLWKLWGLEPGEAPLSSFTIGIDEPAVVAEKVRRAGQYPILKIKVGTDRDREILEAVRGEAPDATLRVDANAAWTADEALARLPLLAEYGVEFVEQPLPPDDRDGLRRVYESSPLPIILDESSIVSADIPGLVGRAHGINIKLAKCGGPREALRMIHTARACGLQVMLGCMIESSLGIAPAAHLSPLVDYADLDGAALLKRDPFVGPHLEGPRIVLGDRPGLGVSLP
ncbi:MAG: dipeptide epimerase [Gemmatimonadota bacterium]|nr:MAG: dipeptide epimerase [Gemmatimonadota bacterium]